MCKELKRLTELSQCKHLNKTDKDAITWAIYQIEPPEVSPDKGFDGFDFSSWPEIPDKKMFNDLIRARKAKHKVIMNQAYINAAAPHMYQLVNTGIPISKSLEVATITGWQGFRANWVIKEVNEQVNQPKSLEEQLNDDSWADNLDNVL